MWDALINDMRWVVGGSSSWSPTLLRWQVGIISSMNRHYMYPSTSSDLASLNQVVWRATTVLLPYTILCLLQSVNWQIASPHPKTKLHVKRLQYKLDQWELYGSYSYSKLCRWVGAQIVSQHDVGEQNRMIEAAVRTNTRQPVNRQKREFVWNTQRCHVAIGIC